MTGLFIAACVASLSGTPHCLAMCGGFAASCSSGGQLWAWHLGRISTYAVLGATAATVGAVVPGPPWVLAAVSIALVVWFAAALAGIVPEPRVRWPFQGRLLRLGVERDGVIAGFGFGVANGLLPCGLVYAALALPIASASTLAGALLMVAFGLGTLPGLTLLAAGVRRWLEGGAWRRWAAAGVVLSSGVWSILVRYAMSGHGMTGTGITH